MKYIFKIIALNLALVVGSQSFASESKEDFNAADYAIHHALDAHEIHLIGDVTIPLPIILWTENGLVTFMSSAFEHNDDGHVQHEVDGLTFVKIHEKIYQLDAGAHEVKFDEEHHPTNAHAVTMDFSLTKNVVTMFLIAILMLLAFLRSAKRYKKDPNVPRGIAKWTEPVILFVRDVAKDNIQGDQYKKFTPYLLTVFFFILFGNLLGLIPLLANPNVTGSISITILLAMFTFVIQLIFSKKNFWLHVFDPLGNSMSTVAKIPLYIILVPIEFLGVFIKPAALLIRLFANITAGHIIVVSLISIIFVNQFESGTGWAWSALSVPFTLFISTLEILVAFLQAYIFMMLSALFIGMAVEKGHH